MFPFRSGGIVPFASDSLGDSIPTYAWNGQGLSAVRRPLAIVSRSIARARRSDLGRGGAGVCVCGNRGKLERLGERTVDRLWTEGPRTGNAAVRYSVLRNAASEARLAMWRSEAESLQSAAPPERPCPIGLPYNWLPAKVLAPRKPPSQFPNLDLVIGHFSPLVPEGQPVIGDWTGNGMMRIGVFHDGTSFLDLNGNRRWDGKNGRDGVFSFGLPGDIAVPGDWTGDGKTRLGVFRRGEWMIDMNGNMTWTATANPSSDSSSGMLPVVAKWIYRRANRVESFGRHMDSTTMAIARINLLMRNSLSGSRGTSPWCRLVTATSVSTGTDLYPSA